jgi:hypothetical protein
LLRIGLATAACSSAAEAVQPTPTSAAMAFFGGGNGGSGDKQTAIQYVNIATTGNSYMFGDLTVARRGALLELFYN